MKKVFAQIATLFMVLLWLGCSSGQTAGGAGGETNTGLKVALLDGQGKPVPQARFRIRPAWYVQKDSTQSAIEELPVVRYADGFSDSRGRIEWGLLAPGSYVLDVQGSRGGLLYRLDIADDDSLVDLGELRIADYGKVTGQYSLRNNTPVLLQVYGTERMVWTDSSGFFSLDSLPPGERLLRVSDPVSGNALSELRLPSTHDSIYLDTQSWSLSGFEASTWPYALPLDLVSSELLGKNEPRLVIVTRTQLDFSLLASDASDLRIVDSLGNSIPMQLRYWDAVAGRGIFWVRSQASRVWLLYGKKGATGVSDSSRVWEGVSASTRNQLLHIQVDNFEDGDVLNGLAGPLTAFPWYRGLDSLAKMVWPHPDSSFDTSIQPDVKGRSQYALHMRYTAPASSWVLAGCQITDQPRDYRMLDSVVFWARGDGQIYLALENGVRSPFTKAWAQFELKDEWTRFLVRPKDMEPPGMGWNVGWDSVRDSITTLSVFGKNGSEFWIDDIDMYGLHPDELR